MASYSYDQTYFLIHLSDRTDTGWFQGPPLLLSSVVLKTRPPAEKTAGTAGGLGHMNIV